MNVGSRARGPSMVALQTRTESAGLLARIAEPLERDVMPERPQEGVDALLGARLVEGRDGAFPDSLVEELERASLREPGSLEVGLGEHGFDRAIDFDPVRHAEGEATGWL